MFGGIGRGTENQSGCKKTRIWNCDRCQFMAVWWRMFFTKNLENYTIDHLSKLYGALEFLA